jgi:hypothetical protein
LSVALLLGVTGNASAQALKDVQTPTTPSSLKAQGQLLRRRPQGRAEPEGELGNLGPGGHIVV